MKHLVLISFLFSLIISTNAQTLCSESFDFSSTVGWTQVGTNVEVSNGKLNFLNGATCSSQRRVHRNINSTLNSGDAWSIKFELYVDSVGQQTGQNMTGMTLAALTAGTQEPFNNCPNVSCTNYPLGTQDGIMAVYGSPNPGTGLTYYYIKIKDGSAEYTSPRLNCNIFKSTLYVKLEKLASNTIVLNIYSDTLYSLHVPNSPVSIVAPASVNGLNVLQHGNVARGSQYRQFWGFIDNVCLNYPVVTSLVNAKRTNVNFKIYPNPANSSITIKGIEIGDNVQFFNIAGQIVLEKVNQLNISLDGLHSGIYFVRVKNKQGYIETRKLIVQ